MIAKVLAWLHQIRVVLSQHLFNMYIALSYFLTPRCPTFECAKVSRNNFTSSRRRIAVNNEIWECGSFKKDVYDRYIILLKKNMGTR